MRQWHEQKRQAGDALLLFRMGDFYELFYEDAVAGARLLGITLTSRDGGRTPLAGIPHHALESYLSKLVAAGRKVAISEQTEDAKLAKGVVSRAIVRVVTPGTLTDDALLQRTQSNVLAAAHVAGEEAGLAALEISTGELVVQLCRRAHLADELARLAPAEILLSDESPTQRLALEGELRERSGAAITYRSSADFTPHQSIRRLTAQYETRGLEGFGFTEIDASLQAAGALLSYAAETQKCDPRHIQPPRRRAADAFLALDPATLRSLEVERTIRTGARDGSLLSALDGTRNAMGARLLREWLCYPLRDVDSISRRQRCVAAFRSEDNRRGRIRQMLFEVGDISRIVGRMGVQRTSPRDVRALGNGLARLRSLRDELSALASEDIDALLAPLSGLDELAVQLCATISEDAPLTLKDGGIFTAGHHAELDRLRLIGRDGETWLAEYQRREQERSGIPSLKVAYNKVFGFYIEITHTHRERVPADYVRKQTVKNAERYITDELKRYETDVLTADARAKELEYELFVALRTELLVHIPALQRTAAVLAELDILAGWAELSLRRRYCRPEFVAEPMLEIEEGRHPVVELAVEGAFVPNDAQLVTGGKSLALITGPNMAGKSTYIRQVALLTLLAHCGSFVPAQRMRLGVVDRIFTRVGASDELARGQSTFMVEMTETANILHNATARSLVILDEVGRGTSTFDGLSLAWAITEHLATRIGCRSLFATHYHEITELAELLDTVFNLNVAVRETEEQVAFLHRIVPGAAGRSYGLHVAKLAGVPRAVLERAHAVLSDLERHFAREAQRPVLAAAQRRRTRQLRLFEAPEETVVRQLRELVGKDIDPAAAREWIARWLGLLNG